MARTKTITPRRFCARAPEVARPYASDLKIKICQPQQSSKHNDLLQKMKEKRPKPGSNSAYASCKTFDKFAPYSS